MKIHITKLADHVKIPEYQTAGSVGFDFAASKEIIIPSRTQALVPTGLIIATPTNHVLLITARSSLFKKKGLILANGVGTIDSDYRGPEDEIFISVFNMLDTEVRIETGERIAQGLIIPIVKAEFEERTADGESRGNFGSTGDK